LTANQRPEVAAARAMLCGPMTIPLLAFFCCHIVNSADSIAGVINAGNPGKLMLFVHLLAAPVAPPAQSVKM